ncbi:MAG: ISNCY family transposase [Legionella sp.]|nr:ISNCY family transposase [Legionella sp.]
MSKKELRRKSIFDLVRLGQLTQIDASKRLRLSYRQTKRGYQRYLKQGDEGLIHKNRGKVSSNTKPREMKQRVLALYEEKYWDFGPTLAAEKLLEDDNYKLHAETLRLWLKEAGIWQPRRKRKAHRTRRARRARFGELLQLDGSIHAWFSDVPVKQCLMNFVDDATGKTLSLMDTGETTEAAFRLLQWWINLHGIPMAIYVDLKSLYISPKSLRYTDEDDLVEPEWLTHFSKACKVLGIEIIKAYSPQAKGRVERNHAVYQDRFVKELRLKGIKNIEGANQCLKNGFIDNLNRKFMKSPQSLEDAHVDLTRGQCLKDILCWEYTRTVHNDWTIRFENQRLQIPKSARYIRPKHKLSVKKDLNGKLTLWYKEKRVPYTMVICEVETQLKAELGHDTLRRSQISRENKHKSPWGQFNPNWLKKTADQTQITV